MNQSLVSCVMPTKDRRDFVPAAIHSFQEQTYEPRELVILDDGEGSIEDLVPTDLRIRYFYSTIRRPIGAKRNLLAEISRGEIICHWDDDDWSAPGRIADQVKRLLNSGAPLTGYHSILFYEVANRHLFRYEGPCAQYAVGTSLCYLKSWWQTHQFNEQAERCEDNDLVYPNLGLIASDDGTQYIVAQIHPGNTCPKDTKSYREVPVSSLPRGFPLR